MATERFLHSRRKGTCRAMALLLGATACGGPKEAPRLPANSDPDAFRLVVPGPGPRPDVRAPQPTEFVLPNGFRVLSSSWDSGTVALEVRCRVGSSGDPEGRAGVTSLLARMLTEGTTRTTALEQALLFENLGASLDADVGVDTLGLSTETLPSDTQTAVALLGEALRMPGLRDEDFQRAQKERLDDLKAQRQDPDQLAWIVAQRAVFGPLRGRPSSGTPKDVAALQSEHLKERHRALSPEACALFAAGSQDQRALEDAALAAFGDWQRQPLAAPRARSTEPATRTDAVLFLQREDAVQSALVVGAPMPKRSDPGYEARELVNDAFGGLFTSRLNTNLRERNAFTYGAHSSLYATREDGAWFLSTSVHTEVTAPALKELRAEVARLGSEPPTDEELARARADLIQRRRSRLEHDTRLLADLSEAFTFDLSLGYAAEYAGRLDALAREPLDEAARQLAGGAFVTVIVGAAEAEKALREQGVVVQPVDPAWLE